MIVLKRYKVLQSATKFLFGTAVQSEKGWRFIPNVSSRKSSRKFHPTFVKCLPRWTGGLNGTESVEA